MPFSGGWDSAACAVLAKLFHGRHVLLLHISYGQPYAAEELQAATRMAKSLELPIVFRAFTPITSHDGIFADRNARILHCAMEYGDTIYFGSRCPLPMFDRYGDSNWVFVHRMARTTGRRIRAPFTAWPKVLIRAVAHAGGIRDADVYSTEGMS